jgi:hypothetical protein
MNEKNQNAQQKSVRERFVSFGCSSSQRRHAQGYGSIENARRTEKFCGIDGSCQSCHGVKGKDGCRGKGKESSQAVVGSTSILFLGIGGCSHYRSCGSCNHICGTKGISRNQQQDGTAKRRDRSSFCHYDGRYTRACLTCVTRRLMGYDRRYQWRCDVMFNVSTRPLSSSGEFLRLNLSI